MTLSQEMKDKRFAILGFALSQTGGCMSTTARLLCIKVGSLISMIDQDHRLHVFKRNTITMRPNPLPRKPIMIREQGKEMTLKEYCEEICIPYATGYKYFRAGFTAKQIRERVTNKYEGRPT